jgi:hypothetical protein
MMISYKAYIAREDSEYWLIGIFKNGYVVYSSINKNSRNFSDEILQEAYLQGITGIKEEEDRYTNNIPPCSPFNSDEYIDKQIESSNTNPEEINRDEFISTIFLDLEVEDSKPSDIRLKSASSYTIEKGEVTKTIIPQFEVLDQYGYIINNNIIIENIQEDGSLLWDKSLNGDILTVNTNSGDISKSFLISFTERQLSEVELLRLEVAKLTDIVGDLILEKLTESGVLNGS